MLQMYLKTMASSCIMFAPLVGIRTLELAVQKACVDKDWYCMYCL